MRSSTTVAVLVVAAAVDSYTQVDWEAYHTSSRAVQDQGRH